MPNRHYSNSNNYRYGFNGQEKDNEITNGAYTAEFWEYDSRIGRRWNLDPIVKDWQSSYACFSNNPITRIDPNGDDDYFDKKGNFLGSDGKKTNTVRVVTDEAVVANIMKAGLPLSVNPNVSNTPLTEFDYSTSNRTMLSIIVGYYAVQAGINEAICVENNPSSDPDATAYYWPANDYYGVAVNPETGRIKQTLGDANNIVNIFVHEKKHKDDKNTYQPLGHVDAVIAQGLHSSYEKATGVLKAANVIYVAKLLNQALKANAPLDKVLEKMNEANSVLIEGGVLDYDKTTNQVIPAPMAELDEIEVHPN